MILDHNSSSKHYFHLHTHTHVSSLTPEEEKPFTLSPNNKWFPISSFFFLFEVLYSFFVPVDSNCFANSFINNAWKEKTSSVEYAKYDFTWSILHKALPSSLLIRDAAATVKNRKEGKRRLISGRLNTQQSEYISKYLRKEDNKQQGSDMDERN